ncbi:MAG TPA: PAS domain S-box protein [Candidatus Acidoferrales bacterium]|nr:PAS domain S-box protein [Candidatus Acidoferrales bacterium]
MKTLLLPSFALGESRFLTMAVSSTIAAVAALFLLRLDVRLRQNAESYRGLVEQSPDSVLVHRQGKIVFANNACAELLGAFSADQLIGMQLFELVHPEERAWVEQLAARREGDLSAPLLRTERRYIRLDHREIQLDSLVKPVLYQGQPSTQVAFRDISERKRAEEKLQQSEERFYKAFNVNPEPLIINTLSEGRYVDVNDSFLRVTGYRREEVIGRTAREMNLWKRHEDRARYLETLSGKRSVRDLEIIFQTKAGAQRTGLISAEFIDIGGEKCAIAVIRDVTERNVLELQLRQAQKMEAIGQLTGGIAHDFNNLLGVIIGYGDTLEAQLDQGSKLQKSAVQIQKAAQRAASLTRQLLAFSRQQMLEPAVLGLNTIVVDLQKMLKRLIGENIELTAVLDPELGRVKADQGQIEQVLINLVVNARDAMPHGGTLRIETANLDADGKYVRQYPPMSPGSFIMLAVTDTGVGMDPETQAHIFEPFFTTKERGKGTGLGLATVYGVVKQSGGFIWVRSEPGHGTTFTVLLPRVEEPVTTVAAETSSTDSWRGSETILLAEDEESLRKLIVNMLSDNGYSVLEAANAGEAVEMARKVRGKIDLLLTDVVMPGMSGPELANELVSLYPGIKVLYMSGYAEFGSRQNRASRQDHPLLQKPFTQQTLARKVREVLKSSRAPVLSSR